MNHYAMLAFTLIISLVSVHALTLLASLSTTRCRRPTESKESRSYLSLQHTSDDTVAIAEGFFSMQRRQAMKVTGASLFGVLVGSHPSYAGDVGDRITEAVTTSDLGVSVRRSVVRGAQVIDKADGEWERFSDRFGLGTERSRREGRPKQKVIPDPKPLDIVTARQILEITDNVFSSLTGMRPTELKERIQNVDQLVRPSFERSGLSLNENLSISTGPQFNYASFVHFKAYTEYLTESKTNFPPFRRDFESKVGEEIRLLLMTEQQPKSNAGGKPSKEGSFEETMRLIDQLCETLVSKGLIAAIDRSTIDADRLDDWLGDAGDLQFDIALDGDITLKAQTLLQDQGFRFYPSYGRSAIQSILSKNLPNQKATVEEYYMDTNENTNPELFEVREVLLNVVLDSY